MQLQTIYLYNPVCILQYIFQIKSSVAASDHKVKLISITYWSSYLTVYGYK